MYKKYFKRLFDLCSSGMALLFLSPLLLYIAYLVKVKLGSPVLFTQIRPGKDNRLFKKKMTGYTESTMINRQTGAGAYFKNFNVETDTFSSAVAAGKLLGATQGGGTFTAKPTITPVTPKPTTPKPN